MLADPQNDRRPRNLGCANQLLKQHGADAWLVASQRADELFAAGELEGHRTFVRILNRIGQLEALEPGGAIN